MHSEMETEDGNQGKAQEWMQRQMVCIGLAIEFIHAVQPEASSKERVIDRVAHDGILHPRNPQERESRAEENYEEWTGAAAMHEETGTNRSFMKTHTHRNQSFQLIFFPSRTVRGW